MEGLLNKLNISFLNLDLYVQALTHPSYENENVDAKNNQRLEFLGDAIFDVIISEYLFTNLNVDEGSMTKLRAMYVRESALCVYAKEIDLDSYIRVGKGVIDMSDAIIADAFESLVAAIYLDLGLCAVQKFFVENVQHIVEKNQVDFEDYKSKLQELVQVDKRTVVYKEVSRSGPSHNPAFDVAVYLDDIVLGTGSGKSKKIAEQAAAKSALKKMAKG